MSHLELAPIGNCAIASLIDAQARHVWFCFPRLDGDPLFNALVNGKEPESGFMDITVEGFSGCSSSYLRNTPIRETILKTESGEALRVLDFAPRFRRFGRSFHPPMLIRRIEPLNGRPRIALRIRPSFDYGATKPTVSIGSNHARFSGSRTVLRVTADIGPSYYLNEAEFLLDRPISLFIGSDESINEEPDGLCKRFLHETQSYWSDWARALAIPFEWQEAVIRAALTLKLCSYEETGAIVAALTTSLPEAPDTARNWDYRYCWLRDSYFTVDALNRLGATHTMEDFVRFLMDAVVSQRAKDLPPLYAISMQGNLAEWKAEALSGFRGMGPVRIGNAAAGQQQNDCFGSIILSAAQLFWDARVATPGNADLYQRLKPLGDAALKKALVPDSGVWEYRTRNAIHTYSAAMCWAAAHRLGLIAARIGEDQDAVRWAGAADRLKDEIMRRAMTSDGWISGALDTEVADASVLLLPQIGVIAATDDAFLKTLAVIETRLLRNGFVLRYNEADDFGMPSTAFLVCTNWYIDALALTGKRDYARELFENLLQRRNSAGLFSEDIDPQSGELWGNFPQTYTQVGTILSAHRLSCTWEQGLWHAS